MDSIRINNYIMQAILDKLANIQEKINLAVPDPNQENYGLNCFLAGVFYHRKENVDQLLSFMDNLHTLKTLGRISNSIYEHILMMAYQKPDDFTEISNIIEYALQNQEFQLLGELEKIFKGKASQNMSDEQLQQQEDDHKMQQIEQNINEHKNEKLNNYIVREGTVEFENQDQNIKEVNEFAESQALAKKLQEQEELLAKSYVPRADQTLCEICYVGLYEAQFLPLQNCEHIFHKQCLSEAFKAQISENNFPLKCPNDTCESQEVEDNDIKQILNSELYIKYQQNTLKFYADMHGDSISWCPTADCGYMFFYEKDDDPRFRCPECHKEYCLNCRAEWHTDMSCKEYQISSTHNEEDDKFLSFVKGKKFKQCPKCKFWVQKNKGCDHMTCKCKFDFCYKCGGVFLKCECVQKAKKEAERRRLMQEQRQRKKRQRLQKKQAQPKPKQTRSRRKKVQ